MTLGAQSKSPDLETMEALSRDPERGHIPTWTTAPPDMATEVTTSIPASLPPLVPPSCLELGPIVQHPGGATRDTICSICKDPNCQGEQEHNIHYLSCGGAMHRHDSCPANTCDSQTPEDLENSGRMAMFDTETVMTKGDPTTERRWVREVETEEEF